MLPGSPSPELQTPYLDFLLIKGEQNVRQSFRAAVPNLFGTSDPFCGGGAGELCRSHRPWGGAGGGAQVSLTPPLWIAGRGEVDLGRALLVAGGWGPPF